MQIKHPKISSTSAGNQRRTARSSRPRPGAIAVLMAVLLVILLGMVAFAVDVGYISLARTELQASVDSSALAAASVMFGEKPLENSRAEAAKFAALHRVAGDAHNLDPQGVELGVWDRQTRAFTPLGNGQSGNAARVTSKVQNVATFFGPVLGQDRFAVSASAVVSTKPREFAFVVDLSGSMNDDTEPCWATQEISAKFGAATAAELVQKIYDDFGFGTGPGVLEHVGTGLDITLDNLAYADLTSDISPLVSHGDPYYRINTGDNESTRKIKSYRWIIDNQIRRTMPRFDPAAGNPLRPTADSRISDNYRFWDTYLDYVLGTVTIGAANGDGSTPPGGDPNKFGFVPAAPVPAKIDSGRWLFAQFPTSFTAVLFAANTARGGPPFNRGYLPTGQDWRRLYNDNPANNILNNPNRSSFPNADESIPDSFLDKIGYQTFVQFMMDFGRDMQAHDWANFGLLTPLAIGSGSCPRVFESTPHGKYAFPPRTQPMHSARRSLIVALEEVREHNQGSGDEQGRDWVSVVSFDRPGAALLQHPLGGKTADLQNAINTCVDLQASNDNGSSTVMEEGLIIALNHLRPASENGLGRETTHRVVVVVTDGLPTGMVSNSSAIAAYTNSLPASRRGHFYGTNDERDAALMRVAQMGDLGWDVYAVGVGAGVDNGFMTRMALLGNTKQPYLAGADPASYERQLTELLREILNKSRLQLVD
ncbi:MAG: pilus assembly protein TadG-related protein [Planctomycetota bacterium]|nr:pilus assembly protein TadG-related protein [Planctomycetota bacterium]